MYGVISGVTLIEYAPPIFPSLSCQSKWFWVNKFFAREANFGSNDSNVDNTSFLPSSHEYFCSVTSGRGEYTSNREKSRIPASFDLRRKNRWKSFAFSLQLSRSAATASSGTSFEMFLIDMELLYFLSLIPSFLQSLTSALYISPMTSEFC